MVVIGVAVMDMRQIGAELVVGDGVSVRFVVGSAMAMATLYSKTGSRGSPFADRSRARNAYHFCVPYQSSTSLRT